MFLLASCRNVAKVTAVAQQQVQANTFKLLSTSASRLANSPATTPSSDKIPNPTSGTHKPTSMDKRYLVWSGKYKSAADVPDFVQLVLFSFLE